MATSGSTNTINGIFEKVKGFVPPWRKAKILNEKRNSRVMDAGTFLFYLIIFLIAYMVARIIIKIIRGY
jgi:hypothetical protein